MSINKNRNKAILVTGASSGIGEATALELDKQGYKVFATVRKESDAERLLNQSASGLETILLDVTHYADVDKAVASLSEKLKNQGLFGLVNNAGIADFTPIEALSMESLRHVFEVNFFATVNLTQLLIPLLRKAKGRIINVSSVGGLTTIPFGFALCASKHAIESLSDGLRLELKNFGIEVITINPSSIASRAAFQMKDTLSKIIENLIDEHAQLYANALRKMGESMYEAEINGVHPRVVAKTIIKAIDSKKPKVRYPIGPSAWLIYMLGKLLPDRWFDGLKLKLVGIRMKN